ncbi:MAG: hypothetical protein AAGJ93_03675 [Bacteroidota bacterium]
MNNYSTVKCVTFGIVLISILIIEGCSDNKFFTIEQDSGMIANRQLRSFVQDGVGRTGILNMYSHKLNPSVQFPEDTSKYRVYRDKQNAYIVVKDVIVSFQDSIDGDMNESLRLHLYENGRCELTERNTETITKTPVLRSKNVESPKVEREAINKKTTPNSNSNRPTVKDVGM